MSSSVLQNDSLTLAWKNIGGKKQTKRVYYTIIVLGKENYRER